MDLSLANQVAKKFQRFTSQDIDASGQDCTGPNRNKGLGDPTLAVVNVQPDMAVKNKNPMSNKWNLK